MPTATTTLPAADYTAVESEVNRFLDEYESSAHKGLGYLVRRPRRFVAALGSARGLPVLPVDTSGGLEGRAVRRELSRGQVRLRTPLHTVSAAIAVPQDLCDYDQGAAKQTLRRKVRAAEKRGITWERVTDADRKHELIRLADDHERHNEIARYADANPSNDDLADYDLWLLARDADGVPLLLSVTPIDSGIAALRYFRTLVAGDDASLARYLMTKVLVEQLHARGVRHLVDTTISMHLSHGLRHFQRMVGFRLVRLELPSGGGTPQIVRSPDRYAGRASTSPIRVQR